MGILPIVRHEDARFTPDARRVITKPFLPGEENFPDGHSRIDIILRRVAEMSEEDVVRTLRSTAEQFVGRHRDIESIVEENFATVAERFEIPDNLSDQRRLLIGSYFTNEYSIEAAALGNPSIVLSPDQSGLADGEARFVMSLRAIGEGHISSIEFRTGVVNAEHKIVVDEPSQFVGVGERTTPSYDKAFFTTKLGEIGALNDVARIVLDALEPRFTMEDLELAILELDRLGVDRTIAFETIRILHWLASSNYRLTFDADADISERVLFPSGPTESRGMEDARFVRFVHDDGEVVFYATYTAYDGFAILPQLIETRDFVTFRISTLSGQCAQNKGIALFPRKLNGQFLALGRQDNVNNFLMTSPDIRAWHETELIQEPSRPWELMQLGNCGSPLETEAGWLVITHGVGPFRTYSLGALLLDLNEPSRVIGHLKEPLLEPITSEREGYVPNVVYSCGSMIHDGALILPYGYADVGASIASVDLDDLLGRLT